jgi:uncharacterized protein (TIGR02588 family)
LIAALVGLTVWQQIAYGSAPPEIEAQPQRAGVRRAGNAHYLPVEVTNRGGQTAQDIAVRVRLAPPDGEPEEVEFLVPFLAGGATARGTVILRADPAQGELRAEVVSYIAP